MIMIHLLIFLYHYLLNHRLNYFLLI